MDDPAIFELLGLEKTIGGVETPWIEPKKEEGHE
jgi:hypothetical protein